MAEKIAISRSLFINDVPLLDVRAPVEYEQGSFPMAENIPILDNRQREETGICYKNHGQTAAIEMGKSFYPPARLAEKVANWQQWIEKHPGACLYCFRGGLRSRLSQEILANHGIKIQRIAGGYKAMRRFLLNELDRMCKSMQFTLVGGLTGVGKTDFIARLDNAIDLEGLANHKGSAFGNHPDGQPSQVDFENRLIIELLKLEARGINHIVLEDEGSYIGSVSMPEPFRNIMLSAPIIILETDDETRLEIGLRDYVLNLLETYRQITKDESQAQAALAKHLMEALARIQKRLGGKRYEEIRQQLQGSLRDLENGTQDGFRNLVKRFYDEYYDPMYDYQISRKGDRIIQTGSASQLSQYLATRA